MKKTIFLSTLLVFLSIQLGAQLVIPWKFTTKHDFSIIGERSNVPEKYMTVQLDLSNLEKVLDLAPYESFDGKQSSINLTLPLPDGSFEDFSIVESSVMHPDLAKKFPMIKSYLGYGAQNKASYLRFDLTPLGFHAIILSGDGNTIYIEPISREEKSDYIVYYNKDTNRLDDMECLVDGETPKEEEQMDFAGDCGVLRTYRLAFAATGEFTTFFGGTVTAGLAALNTLVNYVNAVYEKELHVRFQLVPNNNTIVFTNATTDPYTNVSENSNGSGPLAMLTHNQTTCDLFIGNGSYDIGHVIHMTSTMKTGVASVDVMCTAGSKAMGTTWNPDPNSTLIRETLLHELGHQLGATHTYNGSNCPQNSLTSVETGIGSTIMGSNPEVGCSPGYQNYRDAYFHAINLVQIGNVLNTGCAMATVVNNTAPSANAGPDRIFPRSTKFILSAVGNDNEDAVTYCWEQIDATNSTMPPLSTATAGPAFRSRPPTTSPDRIFRPSTWEVLPSVARTLNFRVTVRDNSVLGGCTMEDDMMITVIGTTWPFLLTSPNGGAFTTTNLPVCPRGNLTVTWNVASTNVAPINCNLVDIWLSNNGGSSYPILLTPGGGTPNDGSHTIDLTPFNIVANTNYRIMVRSRWATSPTINTFFDDSDQNVTFDYGVVGFLNGSLNAAPNYSPQNVCINTNNSFRVVSPCGSIITAFPTSGTSFPPFVQTSFSSNTFSFKFTGSGCFAVTFRVTTPTGFSDRIFVFCGNPCGGGIISEGSGDANENFNLIDLDKDELDDNWDMTKLNIESLNDMVNIYPNPSNSSSVASLEIPFLKGECEVYLYNTLGNLLKTMRVEETLSTIDLLPFQPGIYFIKIKSPYFSITKEFIISGR
ncbi:MAG: M12 family metallo-peptidase [Saprospiraceae bacterium]